MKNKTKVSITAFFLIVFLMISSCDFRGEKEGDNISPSFSPTPVVEDFVIEKTPLLEKTEKPQKAIQKEEDIIKTETPIVQKENSKEEKENSVSILIECKTIFSNLEKLSEEKKDIVPENGVILPKTNVEFVEGESAFDLLLRITKNNKIHLEFVTTPAYNSVYVEGIANLYEFDCGDKSGWTYKVNGEKQNYGASSYILKAGDEVEWNYTCDMGRDI